jgi:hypothetical protein
VKKVSKFGGLRMFGVLTTVLTFGFVSCVQDEDVIVPVEEPVVESLNELTTRYYLYCSRWW